MGIRRSKVTEYKQEPFRRDKMLSYPDRDYIKLNLLYEESGIGFFESDDENHTMDIPLNFIGQTPDGQVKEYFITDECECYMVYEDDGGVTFISIDDEYALYLKTRATEIGYEITSLSIIKKVVVQ